MKKGKTICVCGHFAFGENKLNGQTVKTKIITQGLIDAFGEDALTYVDSSGRFRGLLTLPYRVFKAARSCDHMVILLAYKGLRVVTPILALLRLFFHFQVHYVIVGGWIARFMDNKPFLRFSLRHAVDWMYPETSVLRDALAERGFTNALVMPNFKALEILPSPLAAHQEPYRLCTFSRVMKQKGMEDAMVAVSRVNETMGRTVYDLTIYGPVWHTETGWFDSLQQSFPSYVHYGGSVPFDQSVAVLKDYFALLFPTRFFTEGVPGTLIDAYAAGLPVISSRWESFADVVDDGCTGYGYTFESVDALTDLLMDIACHPQRIESLRQNCLDKAKSFLPQSVMPILTDRLV